MTHQTWLFNAETTLLEEQRWHYITHSRRNERVHIFPNGISQFVNVEAKLESCLKATVQHKSYQSTAIVHFRSNSLEKVSIPLFAQVWVR